MTNTNSGFIKLYRSITDWEWYTEPNVIRLYLHCILKSNFKDKTWCGTKLPAGSFVTSYQKLASELELTVGQIRTALKKLKKSENITHKIYAHYSIITVNNYIKYQNDYTQYNIKITSKLHHDNTSLATTKNIKKGRKEEYNIRAIIENLRKEDEENGRL